MKYFWHTSPYVRLIIPFVIGVFIGLKLPFANRLAVIACVVLCVVGVVGLFLLRPVWRRIHRRSLFGMFVTGLLLFMGFSAVQIKYASPRWEVPEAKVFKATVNSFPNPKAKTFAVRLKVEDWQDSLEQSYPCRINIIAYIAMDSMAETLTPGDELLFRGNITTAEPPANPGQFDYSKYLFRQGIAGTVYLPGNQYVKTDHRSNSFFYAIQRWRAELIRKWRANGFSERENAVIAALILGDRSYLDPDLRADFAGAGAVHILAVSGLHVGIIYLFAVAVLGFLLRGKRWKWMSFILVLVILWFYAAITGFSPSVLRAATMFSFIALGKFHGHRLNVYNMIFASAFFLLMIDPFLLGQVGFQLSYLAVLGIVYLHPKIYGLVYTRYWLPDKLWSLFVVSFCAQLATFPLSIYYFNQFPTYFFFTNLLVIPLAWVILHAGVIWLITFTIPIIGDVFAHIANGGAYILNEVVLCITSWPGAVLEHVYFTGFTGLLVYLFIAALIAVILRPGRFRLRVLYVFAGALLAIYAYQSIERKSQTVYFFPANAPVATAVKIEGQAATVYVAERHPDIESDIGYLINGFLRSRGVKIVRLLKAPHCNNPTLCSHHPVHCITTDEFAGLDPEKIERSVVYVNDESGLNVAMVELSHSIVVGGGVTIPTVIESGQPYEIHALTEDGAVAMKY